MKTIIQNFDPVEYDFVRLLQTYIGAEDLTRLTTDYTDADDRSANSFYKSMEQSPHFRRMYAGLESDAGQAFYQLYERFVREVIRPQYPGPIYFQARPSHRILFADTPGESRFHRDGDYGHHAAEVNYQVAQTPVYGNNAMWIESQENLGDYAPVELAVGQYARFRGVSLSHGARANDTGRSRVTFDFRVIPADLAPAAYVGAAHGADAANPVQRNARNFRYCE